VEDRRELRELMRATLEAAGYAILTAADGIEALALADTRNVDLVVTDVVMPRLGGKALVRALRQTNPRLRALFVSGHLEHASDPGALDDGERLLRKPFPLEGLRRAVREVLDAPPRTSAER
jgi:CheY-like chemotaxis protein